MPRRYKNTRKRSRPMRRSAAISSALATYQRPFAQTTHAPKIPDGKSIMSCGLRQQCSHDLTLPAGGLVMVITPSYRSGMAFMERKDVTDQTIPAFDLDSVPANFGLVTSVNFESQMNRGSVDRAHVVSMGAKFMCTSSANNNDGYWESFRIPNNQNEAIDLSKRLDNPTYCSGKTRDIGKYEFTCKPTNTDHDFQSPFAMNQHDWIVIMFRGSTAHLVAHAVSNMEYLLDEKNGMHRFMTAGLSDRPALAQVQKSLLYNMKAATKVAF
jgi:hypothetical protein